MAENVRFALEKEEKLQEEVLLEDKDFIVDLVEVVFFLWTVMVPIWVTFWPAV